MFRSFPATLLILVLVAAQVGGAWAVPETAAAVEHALARLTFGARPGEAARVRQLGLGRWIDQQLLPDRLDDDAVETGLASLETLSLSAGTLLREYHQPAIEERRQRRRESAAQEERQEPGPVSRAQQRNRQIVADLEQAKLVRAIHSERQLQEVLVDFWFNHFNVFAGKGPTRALVTSFERDAIRPHVLGDFRTMLEAVASSPAMLFYLDNWQSVGADVRRSGAAQARTPARGLNENYARELLELHTLGVDGGYTQGDIVNVARAFTGWTFRPREDASFVFTARLHDAGEKRVLGHTIKGRGGIEDGRKVLDILAAHPSTARFVATKLAQKFVADVPPSALVERAARRFTETRGNLREVTRTIVTSPELFDEANRRTLVKTPLEFVVSALRTTGADVQATAPLIRLLQDFGMAPYFCLPPTGYAETADTWVSSGALVARMNFAVGLAAGRIRGVRLPPGSQQLALAIGAPEFQRQ